jgi:aryl-alcohol dehydrogenase-like predicted oxidoreductase
VPWGPLGMGYLTGTVTPMMVHGTADLRAGLPRFTPEARRANWPVVELLQQVGTPSSSSWPNRACLAARTQAVDRAHSRADHAGPHGAEHGRASSPADRC